MLFLVGALVFGASWSYEIGTLRRMGPGYFPMILGAALCAFSLLIVLREALDNHSNVQETSETVTQRERVALRPLLLLPLSIALFAALLESWGLVPAVFISVAVAGFADQQNHWLTILLIAVATSIFTSLVFVYALGVPLRLVAM